MFALALAAVIAASPADQLVGDWAYEDERWTFRADGTGASVDDPKFKYRADAKKVTVTYPDGSSDTFAWRRAGDKLELTIDGEKLTFSPKAAGGKAAVAPKSAKAQPATGDALKLVGTWVPAEFDADDESFIFKADGSGVAADPFVWTADGKSLVLHYPEGPQKLTYSFKGESLVLVDRGAAMTLKRKVAKKK